ncbi:hypothetical protein B7494_g152 [Chlorociboria aeruginascens]|nr:hypothetical protein B7494_g152 [Chlorociboria aeruginascens]
MSFAGDGDRTHSQPPKRSYSEEPSLVASLENTGKKRRATNPSSRGVANLTPDQLAKKRANDREAQKAIRERTKNQIKSLERKVRELTSQQPYQELQSVLRQKELVEAENADIKKQLAAVLSLIQPILGQQHGQYYRVNGFLSLNAFEAFEIPQYASPLQPSYSSCRPSSSTLSNIPSPGTATGSQWQASSASMTPDPRGNAQAQTHKEIQAAPPSIQVCLAYPDSEELVINPVFEHLRRLDNWSLGLASSAFGAYVSFESLNEADRMV